MSKDTNNITAPVPLASARVRELEQVNAELVEVLDGVEWNCGLDVAPECSWCKSPQSHGHAPDCRLAAALAKAREVRK